MARYMERTISYRSLGARIPVYNGQLYDVKSAYCLRQPSNCTTGSRPLPPSSYTLLSGRKMHLHLFEGGGLDVKYLPALRIIIMELRGRFVSLSSYVEISLLSSWVLILFMMPVKWSVVSFKWIMFEVWSESLSQVLGKQRYCGLEI